ncbi:Smr/MutS family protein [Pacificimonas sp. WHA3]|uniref:Smr/MutS family protein n=1 Tax=Pacificimonas pallii TaxID=2827236 RepID=A0ABS6SFX4_9SPHN|nr:Smr/MutS family protein [Pacificimonas pallii]
MPKRPKSLPAQDRALWDQVASTVRPLGDKPVPVHHSFPRVDIRERAPTAPTLRPSTVLAAPERASLDGGWDRRVRKGQIVPDRTVDLHGLTRDGAYDALERAIHCASRDGVRTLLVITGKPRSPAEAPRGIISKSLPVWLETPQLRPFVSATRPAHARHGGNGAVYVVLRRAR